MQTATLPKAKIDLSQWTLADWLHLAEKLSHDSMWAWYRYLDHSANKTELATFSILQWEEIARELEKNEKWAYYRYKEYNA